MNRCGSATGGWDEWVYAEWRLVRSFRAAFCQAVPLNATSRDFVPTVREPLLPGDKQPVAPNILHNKTG